MPKRPFSTPKEGGRSTYKVLTSFLLVALLAACSPQAGTSPPQIAPQPDISAKRRAAVFVPAARIAGLAVLFRTLGDAGTLFFEQHQVVFPLPAGAQAHPWFSRLLGASPSDPTLPIPPLGVRMQFIGANANTQVVGQGQLPGIVNYFLGEDAADWQTGVPTFGSLVYEDIYPGIDLVYNGGGGVLKGTYLVAPGANPDVIRWRYEGASQVELSEGELLIGADEAGQDPLFIERSPVAWQTVSGKRSAVNVQYALHDNGSVGFVLGKYDAAQPLVIDPTLDYSTYWGLCGCDGAYHIAVDANNNVYITGATNSQGYPQANPNCDETPYFDVFVTKLDPSQTGVNQHIYTTYFGGSELDLAVDIGVDTAGNAYVAGFTYSNNLPTTANAYQRTARGGDAIVVQLNATGAIQYLSYLGGTDFEELQGMAVVDGLMYVLGCTDSPDFPTTPATAYSSTRQSRDVFVSVLDTSKSGVASLLYSTLYGGSSYDEGYAIAVANGIIYFAGTTRSTDLPLKNAVQATFGGGSWGDVFAAVLDTSQPGTSQLLFATYLGGSANEIPGGVAPSGTEHLYVTGITQSSNFPTTAVSPSFGGNSDGFLTKLDVVAPTALVYSRFVGGNGEDGLRGLAVDSQDNAYVAGNTGSSNFQTVAPLQATFQGGSAIGTDTWWFTSRGATDALVAKFDPNGTMTFGTFLGGTGADGALGLRLGADGKVYVGGVTRSTDFSTVDAFQSANAGTYDAFVAAIGGLLPLLPGDMDNDCDVDIVDIMLVASHWGSATGDPNYDPYYDLDDDGDIDIVDIMLVALHWGDSC